jgi:hypothetical protein
MKSAYGDCNVAVGSNALANNIEGYFNVAVGYAAIYAAVDELLTAVGANCQAVGLACTLVGYNTFATGEGAITIGSEAVTDGLQSIAIGQAVDCNGIGSICIGGEAEVAALASICIGHAGTSDGEGTVAIGDAIEVTGAGSIGIGEGAAINGAGIIGIGNGITVDGAGAIGMGNGVAVVGAACIGIGDGTDAAGAGAIGIGNGVSVDGAGCIAIGNGVLMVGESGIAIGDGAIALLDQIEIGSVANEIGGCFIHGILEGGTDDPFVLNYVPIIGTVTYEVCAACAVLRPGQLRGLDLLNAELTRGQSEKLMQLEPVFYRSAYDSTQVKARLVAPEDPAEFCPELMTTVDGKPTSRLQLDKAFIALLNLVKEHNVLIKDQQMRIASMQIELDELRQKNNR